ncbi:MAG: nitroreductase family protein [Bacillota bacterium]
MDFDLVVQGRRSIRNFSLEKIPEEDIRIIVHYGTLAPTAGGKQGWHCLAISNQLLKDELHRAVEERLFIQAFPCSIK